MLLFLKSRFAKIRRRYQLSASWPSKDVKQTLVQNASGQFIYVATVMRFLEGGSAPPHELLDQVMDLRRRNVCSNPFAPLDALYTHIINSCPNPLLAAGWLSFIFFDSPLYIEERWSKHRFPARFVQLFLESSPGEASYVFRGLNSLVSVPPTGDNTSPYSLFHKSLRDFLSDDSRCGSFYVKHPHELYRTRYMQIWKSTFVFFSAFGSLNISCLQTRAQQHPLVHLRGDTFFTSSWNCRCGPFKRWWHRTLSCATSPGGCVIKSSLGSSWTARI